MGGEWNSLKFLGAIIMNAAWVVVVYVYVCVTVSDGPRQRNDEKQ